MAYQDEVAYKKGREQQYWKLRTDLHDAPMEERHAALSAFEAATNATLDRMRTERRTAAAHRERELAYHRRLRKYGLTPDDYDAMEEAQNGRCRICLQRPERHQFAIDHCHRTGRVRGLLCTRCNTVLGMAHDDIDLFVACIQYLSGE